MYRAEVNTVCRRYNAVIQQIGRKPRGSGEHEVQLAPAKNAVTASEARALMQVPRPAGFGRLERLYRAMTSAANVADESTWLFSTGQLDRADAMALGATRELRAVNQAFRRLGLSICKPNFNNPAEPPGDDWEWRGNGPAGSKEGSWQNPWHRGETTSRPGTSWSPGTALRLRRSRRIAVPDISGW
jgi:hypothetical protein